MSGDDFDATQSEEMASSATTKPKSMASPEHEGELFGVAEILDHVDNASTLPQYLAIKFKVCMV